LKKEGEVVDKPNQSINKVYEIIESTGIMTDNVNLLKDNTVNKKETDENMSNAQPDNEKNNELCCTSPDELDETKIKIGSDENKKSSQQQEIDSSCSNKSMDTTNADIKINKNLDDNISSTDELEKNKIKQGNTEKKMSPQIQDKKSPSPEKNNRYKQ